MSATTATDRAVPRWREPAVLGLLALALLLQAYAWWRLEGYQLADSVEYMDRARIAATGQELTGERAVRSFAFSLVFWPLFVGADLLGLHDLRPLVAIGRLLQMALSLALVSATIRLGARAGGRRVGLAAGGFLALNPVFLRYSVSPVAGIAAALCIVLGTERLLWPRSRRSPLAGGLLVGLAILCSYKSLLVAGVLLLGLAARDRWRCRASWSGLVAGVAAAIGLQSVLDRLVYGRWGGSLIGYVADNVLSRLVHILWTVHTRIGGWIGDHARDAAEWIYVRQNSLQGYYLDVSHLEKRMLRPPEWYLVHLPEVLVWPLLLCFLLGALRALRRPRWPTSILATVLLVFAYVTSTKGDKSFRLWLPIVPFLALFAALGWDVVRGSASLGSSARARAFLAWGLLVVALPLCLVAYERSGPRQNGAYWKAMDWVSEETAADVAAGASPAVGAAFHWAIFLRAAPGIDVRRADYDVDHWPDRLDLPGDENAPARREAIVAYLESLDWFLVHLPVLTRHPGLLAEVNELFSVRAAFYRQDDNAGLGPVFVLSRRSPSAGGRRFFAVGSSKAPPQPTGTPLVRENSGHPSVFAAGLDGRGPLEILALLGWTIEDLPGTPDVRWITYRWTTATGLARDYKLVDRVTGPDAHNSFQNNHWPAYGLRPTSAWVPGQVLTESYLFVPAGNPFAVRQGFRPLGGAYRRGDLIPASLWMRVVDEDADGRIRAELPGLGPADPAVQRALVELAERTRDGQPILEAVSDLQASGRVGPTRWDVLLDPWRNPIARWQRDGAQLSKDGLLEVGRFWLPVDESLALPDDGRRLEYDTVSHTVSHLIDKRVCGTRLSKR